MAININIELDEFHYHEALDRTHMIIEIIDNSMINHVVFHKHSNLLTKAEEAQKLLAEIYQEIGAISVNKFHPEILDNK